MVMKLKKFRIKNYKSIKDSDYCWLASDLTTLAGKNESGKTAILEALRDFDTDVKKLPDEALPLDESGKPVIEMCFDVEKEILDEASQEIGIAIENDTCELIAKKGLTILKLYDGSYKLGKDIFDALNKQIDETNQQHIKKIQSIIGELRKIKQLKDIVKPKLTGTTEAIQQAVTQYINQVNAQLPSVPAKEAEEHKINAKIAELSTENNSLQKESPADKFLAEIVQYTPNFIFFSDFSDILPFEIPLLEAKNNETVQDFAKVANIDLDRIIQTPDKQKRRNLLRNHSAVISGDFRDYWGQDKLRLIAETDADNLLLGVEEEGKTQVFKVGQRSKGLQWFLSFYLRLNARQEGTNIILIDEPGLYLHAKAQQDVLKVLEKISENVQVIFTTHSPYLIDTNRLDRVRLLLKDKRTGTRVENKIHKDADSDTLTPIITAIGLDLTHDFSIAGKHNVLLEGPSDYYYLQALREYMPKCLDNTLSLIPCMGATKIPHLASLLIGWDLPFVAVLDNDNGGKQIKKKLSTKLRIANTSIIYLSEEKDYCIEDLFTKDDFNKYVVGDEKNNKPNMLNSKFVKDKKLDKVLLAKQFFEKVKSDKAKVGLSSETIGSFKNVFDKIARAFNLP